MPWRLIVFIVILGLVVIFAGFNITNASDVSFGFTVVEDVPIFISLFFAFVVGVVVMLPFVVGKPGRKRGDSKAKQFEENPPVLPPDIPQGTDFPDDAE